MNRQTALIALLAVPTVLAVVAGCRGDSENAAAPNGVETVPAAEDATGGGTLTAELYFPDTGGLLRGERREVPASSESAERISSVLETLLAGPRDPGMRAPLPDGVSVREVYLTGNGLAFLDFESAEGAPPPASGSLREILTVYSLVNTVVLNFEDLDRIVLLWNGRQRKTFAGHVDTMRPLAAKTDLIAQSPG